ncbi:MAG: FtsX-like permease family protein [Bacteroidales bacterium]|nr:FtsX-like permease family protein [Bacteroidales bacterium]
MRIPVLIAWRYLFAKKSQNIINVISWISLLGVLVGSAAILIVLSVFNGLHSFIGSLFGAFDPDLKIEVVEGKVFQGTDSLLSIIRTTDGVESATCYLTDNALLKYDQRQMPALVMGVDDYFDEVTHIDSITTCGEFPIWDNNDNNSCAIGYILAQQLGTNPMAFSNQLIIYAPKRVGNINMSNPEQSFIRQISTVASTFAVQQIDYDSQYAIISLKQARKLFCYTDKEVSGIGIKIKGSAKIDQVQRALKDKLGDTLSVKNRWEQHSSFFRMMEVEKFMAFLILLFILAIAAFNIIGTLSMLIYEKKESIFILKAMGATKQTVTRVFLFEGLLVSIGGALIGLILGIILVLVQQHFGIINFHNAASYILDAYPVELMGSDILIVFISVVIVGYLAAWYPVHTIVHKYYDETK